MPRLSLWKDGAHSNDYKFFDRRISEMFTIGGTGVFLHKYLGSDNQKSGTDLTQPKYSSQSEKNIQDLLFLENRDRIYDTSVYSMRGIYTLQDQDFDLRQFGIFLAQGTTFMTFHLNDMVKMVGRKIMSGDVLELVHLKEFDSLDESIPVAIQRFYSVTDASRPAEGFSATWWPHLWRVKLQPLVDSQEYKSLLNNVSANTDPFANASPVGDIISTYNKYMDINAAVIGQAEIEVPKSGYDTTKFYVEPSINGQPADPTGVNVANGNLKVSSGTITADEGRATPTKKIDGYLVGDGTGPNGLSVSMGVAFPYNPVSGDYFLRLDYVPNRLFRFDGYRWVKVEDSVRTNLTPGADDNQSRNYQYVNNTATFTDLQGNVHPQRQSLSKALRPEADN
jgi:hypothetical protein